MIYRSKVDSMAPTVLTLTACFIIMGLQDTSDRTN